MSNFFRRENTTLIGMIVVGVMLIVGIILSWEHVSTEVSGAFKDIFHPGDTTLVTPDRK